jgi:DNA-binding transcriptional MerR regulator
MTNSSTAQKSTEAFRTISEVAEALKLPQHVLRFWETRFVQIKPLKRGGGRRFYRPEDVELLMAIRQLLYGEGYTIRGVQRILKEQGPRAVATLARGQQPQALDEEAPNLSDDTGAFDEYASYDDDGSTEPRSGDPPFHHKAAAFRTEPGVGVSADFDASYPEAQDLQAEARADFGRYDEIPQQSWRPVETPHDAGRGSLAAADIDRLRMVLAELTECRRILHAARG